LFIPIQPAQFALVILPRCWPLVFILVFSAACRNGADRKLNQSKQSDSVVQPERVSALVKKGLSQLPWLKRTGYSQRFILLADLSLPMEPGSNCSSLGRYRFGANYNGRWGNSFRLHGLDPGNNRALQRAIVFHYYQYMTDDPESGSLYYSQGCPMVPKSTYLKVKKIVESESQPLVLWIYK